MGMSESNNNNSNNNNQYNIIETKEKEDELVLQEHNFLDSSDGRSAIPVNLIIETMKSICKVTVKNNGKIILGTGFFMKVSNNKRYLVTNYTIISEEINKDDIEIELHNQKIFKLNFNEFKYFPKSTNITLIEIKTTDEIYKDIKFLYYDLDNNIDYEIYKNQYVFSILYFYGKSALCSTGQIIDINDFKLKHNIVTGMGAGGCPIILLNNDTKYAKVIGIHHSKYKDTCINFGTLIGKVFNDK